MTGGSGGRPGTSHGREMPLDELRQLVREVLADVVGTMPARQSSAAAGPPSSIPPADGATGPAPAGRPGDQATQQVQVGPSHGATPNRDELGSWTVRISTDEELHTFVLRVLKLAANPKLRGNLISGRARFRLAATPAAAAATHQMEKGAVTERLVAAAAAAGARLVLGPRAVLTPLARDKARALGVPIERAPSDTHRER
jgi:hypothetical protein